MRIAIALACLAVVLSPISSLGAGFEPQPNPWVDLLHKIANSGVFSGDDEGTFGLKSIQGPLPSDHAADYANLWGPVIAGKFFPTRVVLVSEQWRAYRSGDSSEPGTAAFCKPQLCRSIDQWDFVLAMNGSIKTFTHRLVVEGVDQRNWDAPDLHPTDAQAKAKLEALLSFWYAFQP